MGCSSNNDNQSQNYFLLNINGTEVSVKPQDDDYDFGYKIIKKGDVFKLTVFHGESHETFELDFLFTIDGNLISAKNETNSNQNGYAVYYNYRNFPSNYFDIQILSINEVSKQIKLKLNGNLYLGAYYNLNTESIHIEADINAEFQIIETANVNYLIYSHFSENSPLRDYFCSAKFNGVPWFARHQFLPGSLTNESPYKIDLNFDFNALPNDYPFNSASLNNCIKFSKFNTNTLSYDFYNVDGVLSYSYREFHGAGGYSYDGTFNIIATNPNDPADVINVSDGFFTCFQQF